MTLEEAQAEILRLQENLTAVTNERDTFSGQVATLTTDLEKVRTLNQQYFLKLSAQYAPTKPETNDETETVSPEEFAKTITI